MRRHIFLKSLKNQALSIKENKGFVHSTRRETAPFGHGFDVLLHVCVRSQGMRPSPSPSWERFHAKNPDIPRKIREDTLRLSSLRPASDC